MSTYICIHLIEESLAHEKHEKHKRCDSNDHREIGKLIVDCDRSNKHYNKTGCINHALKALKERKYLHSGNGTFISYAVVSAPLENSIKIAISSFM